MCLQYHVLGTGFCHVLRLRSDHCDALSGLAMPFQGLIDQERVQGFLQEASHETAEHKTCEAALLNKKRKREAGEGEALGDGTSKQADKVASAAQACARVGTAAPRVSDHADSDCMEVDPPEQPCSNAIPVPQQQQQQQQPPVVGGPKADTPEERAQLLAQLQAEAASAHRHVQGMQPLAPVPSDKQEAPLDRSQAGSTPQWPA